MSLDSPDTLSARRRARLALTLGAIAFLGSVAAYYAIESHLVAIEEHRILTVDYPNLAFERGKYAIAADGLVSNAKPQGPEPPRYAASLRLIPPGPYEAVILSQDLKAKPIERTDIVVAAEDPRGVWHPAAAAAKAHGLPAPVGAKAEYSGGP